MGVFWLLSLLVLGLFGYMLFKAYRYTSLSVGVESPEFHRVTRTFPAWRYFTRTTPLWLGFMSVLVFLMACLTFVASFPDLWARLAVLLTVVGFGVLIATGWKLEMQYWHLVRDIAVTYNPQGSFFEIEQASQQVRVMPSDVAKIEIHQAQGRLEYGYLLFFLRDGRILRLPWLFFFPHEFLQKHFGSVPTEHHRHRLPWVKPLPVSS